jgi:predicted dinucleotide-binding enzyme
VTSVPVGTRVGVLGTGVVGQTLAARLSGLGHGVLVGSRGGVRETRRHLF